MTRTGPLRVLIVDDHPIVRDGLRSVLERRADIIVVGDADNVRDAVSRALHLQPDVALVDFDMPQLDGVGVVKELRRSLAACRWLCAQDHQEPALRTLGQDRRR